MSTIIRFWATLSVLAVFLCSAAFAQQQDARVAQMRAAVAKQLEQFLTQQKAGHQRYLAEIIEDVRKTCGLSKSQLKKLRIAAKGAVEYSMAERQARALGLEKLDQKELQLLNIQFHNQQPRPESVADQPIWAKTFEKTLTAEQHDTYQTALENRVAAKREELTERAMKSIVGFVPMKSGTRDQVAELVSKHLDEKLKRLSGPKAAAMSSQQATSVVNTLPNAEVEKILSRAQMLQWRNFVRQNQLNNTIIRQRQILGVPNVIRNGVILQPVQPNGVIVEPQLRVRIPRF